MIVEIKRVYDAPAPSDGKRILVDRLWPRGITKAKAEIDVWMKSIAPSPELRKWFAHDPAKWQEFEKRYRAELAANPALDELRRTADKENITLLFAAKDVKNNQAVVLKKLLENQTLCDNLSAPSKSKTKTKKQ